MIKKLLLITGRMLSANLWAESVYIESDEQQVCYINVIYPDPFGNPRSVETYLENTRCKEGDVIHWKFASTLEGGLGQHMVSKACNQDIQIIVSDDWLKGVCTYTGKVIPYRTWKLR